MTVQLKVKGYINGNEWGVHQSTALPNVHFTFSGEEASDGVGFDAIQCGDQFGDLTACLCDDIKAGLPSNVSYNFAGVTKLTYSSIGTNFDGIIPNSNFDTPIVEGGNYIAVLFDEDDQDSCGICTILGNGGSDENIILDLSTFYEPLLSSDFYTFIDEWHNDTGHSNLSFGILSYQ